MKKLVAMGVCIALLAAMQMGCAESKEVCVDEGCGIVEVYGVADLAFDTGKRDDRVAYQISYGNIGWSVVFSATVVVPVVLLGWYLWEPVGPKIQNGIPAPVDPAAMER